MSIKENIEEIKRDIKKYKTVDDVLLLAVTKTKPVEDILEAIDAGITDIGENKVQEIQEKYDQVKDKVKIHMIGHLQTNKVKYIVGKVELIHSLDRKSLADEINKRAKKLGIIQNCLLQVNVTKEESKFGCYIENLDSLLEYCNNLENIKIIGLMGMAPFFDNPEDARDNFKKLKELFEKYKNRGYNNITMDKLSMGMSHDYIIALEEGSNLVRVGSKIFGERFY
ncbi:YggS family pyridoxal phosphate-dependent enzyme [Citroniella saccharovorans]|uniref:Pyridoxal phosphate homeostasis protein n=1 Tax=Citroniella saccharovorans TaxID=2053367 RepID=A0AAW9MYD1_9FIRM|nr:YggS family pyridoxal phosphate-dependent enzyme [Citroniella saccharovorans]MEB3429494.1 YggS family pyridoxal phosphate-dependent enzyme [Citroniella saccharovorans]